MSIIELDFSSLEPFLQSQGFDCTCGRHHSAPVRDVIIGENVLFQLPNLLNSRNIHRPCIVCDENTYKAAGEKICIILSKAGITPHLLKIASARPEPDEFWTGAVFMDFDAAYDGILAVGSGTINDICKILAARTRLPYIIAATAPSMDGYASSTSSMVRSGIKVSLPSSCAEIIVADTAILSQAPMPMLLAGLGDMIAKYISICEWRISHLVTGEYYCETIASLVRASLKQCINAAEQLAARDPNDVGYVVKGLILSGMAMSFAGLSRPASGIEHYFSHIWEMYALEHGQVPGLHGLQVGVATLLSLKVYSYIQSLTPDRETALHYAENFRPEEWTSFVRRIFGSASEEIIHREAAEGKYRIGPHKERLNRIIDNWDTILAIIHDELPPYDWLYEKLRTIGFPLLPQDINIPDFLVKDAFLATKDIRDKYIGSRLLWDLGKLEEAADALF